MTWADDDRALHGLRRRQRLRAVRDGEAEPRLRPRDGQPAADHGREPPRADIEARGDGKRGRKASGLLMVDGMLYLWARNAGNAQLAWSTDHGKSWTWADWKFTTELRLPVVPQLRPRLRRRPRRVRLRLLARRRHGLRPGRPLRAGPRAQGPHRPTAPPTSSSSNSNQANPSRPQGAWGIAARGASTPQSPAASPSGRTTSPDAGPSFRARATATARR